jgi:hypothetical protein
MIAPDHDPDAPDEVHVNVVYEPRPKLSVPRKYVVTAITILATFVALLVISIESGGGKAARRPVPRSVVGHSSISPIGALGLDREIGTQAVKDDERGDQ